MSRKLRTIFALSATLMSVGALAIATSNAGAAPTASASSACSVTGKERDYGKNMYLTALATKGTPCSKGFQVVNQYSTCRYSHGGLNGRCPSKIKKFKCHEGKRTVAPGIQYSVNVACTHGSSKVNFSYTQQI